MPTTTNSQAGVRPGRFRKLFTATAVLAVLLTTSVSAFAVGQVGEAAGPWSLTDTEGGTHVQTAYEGEKVLFLFFVGYN
ncbi:MAG: hypothetical protein ABIF77_18595 [bacterium]